MKNIVFFTICLLVAVEANGKRGLCVGDPFTYPDNFQAFKSNKAVSWYYNWSPNPKTSSNDPNLEFVPMQWNGNGIENLEATLLKNCPAHVLAFNEPDLAAQANMTPQQACDLWNQYILPLKTKYGIKIGLPVVTNGGRDWLANFHKVCPNNQADFLPLHWYGSTLGDLYNYIWTIHSIYPQYPIWITEFASTTNDQTEMVNFAKAAVAYLETLDWIQRYAWFGTWKDADVPKWPVATLNMQGNLSPIGNVYVNTPWNNTVVLTPNKCGNTPSPTTSVTPTTSIVPSTTSSANLTQQVVKVQANNGKYLKTQGQTVMANANSTVAGKYQLIPVGGGQLAVKCMSTNMFLSTDNYGQNPILANRSAYTKGQGSWELYTAVNVGGNFALQAAVNNKYVAVQNDGTLIPNGASASGASVLTFVKA